MQEALVSTGNAVTPANGAIAIANDTVYPAGATGITVAGDTVTLAATGLYEINYNLSYTGTATTGTSAVYVEGVPQPSTVRELADGNNVSATTFVNVETPPQTVQVQLADSPDFTSGTLDLIVKQYGVTT